MITITKKNEPQEWKEKRKISGVNYEPIPALRESLLKEQGYICGYCMQRISSDNSKIEHILPQSKYPEKSMDYENIIVCCEGKNNTTEHCDTFKKDKLLSFSLFDDRLESSISFNSKTGEMRSNENSWDRDINDILNLNYLLIKANRRKVLDGVILLLSHHKFKKKAVVQQLEIYISKDKNEKLKPYCGIVRWYLKKKLKNTI